VRFGPPKLLSPTDALAKFSEVTSSGRVFIPLSLSLLSERVISLALRAPEVRSGPRKSSISKRRICESDSRNDSLPSPSVEQPFLNLDQLLVLDRSFHFLRQLRRNILYAVGCLGMFGSLLHYFILGRATRNEITPLH